MQRARTHTYTEAVAHAFWHRLFIILIIHQPLEDVRHKRKDNGKLVAK